jgi:hypothetical protein
MSLQALFRSKWRRLNWSFLITRLQLVPSVWSSLQLPVTALWSCVQHPGKHLSSELLILVQGFLTNPALEFAKARNRMHFLGCRTTKMYGVMATTTLIPLCLLHHQEAYEAEAKLLSGWELRAINHNSQSASCSYLRGIKQEVITISSPHLRNWSKVANLLWSYLGRL